MRKQISKGTVNRSRDRSALPRLVATSVFLVAYWSATPIAWSQPNDSGVAVEGVDGDERLRELAVPELSAEEPEVRAQLESVRADLDTLLEGEDWPSSELDGEKAELVAATFAELGRLYYLYDLLPLSDIALTNALVLMRSNTNVGRERLEWLQLRGVVRALNAEADKAAKDFSAVLAARPESLPALVRRGDVYFDSGRYEDARRDYEKAVELDPTYAAAIAGLGQVSHRLGEHEAAVELLRKALELQPTADSLNYPLAQSLRATGDNDAARAALRLNKQGRVELEDPVVDGLGSENRSSLALYHAGNLAMRRGEMKEAASFYRRYLLRRPDHSLANHNLGLALLAQQQREDGLKALRKAVDLDPEFRGGHYFLAAALAEDGKFDEALLHYRKAHEIDPLEQAIHADYATLLARMGRVDEALAELKPVAEGDPDAHYVRLKYATILSASGRGAEATPLFESLSAASMEPAIRGEALYHLAVDRLNGGDMDGAKAMLEQSVALAAGSGPANAMLAQVLAQSGDLAGAVERYAQAVKAQPYDDRTQFGYAMALLLLDRDQEAREALEGALSVLPGHLALRHVLARVLAASSEESVRDGERALGLAQEVMEERNSLEHAETLAMALAELGRFEEAERLQLEVVDKTEATGRAGPELALRKRRATAFANRQPLLDPWEPDS